jgi:hypothetical protein
MEHGLLAARNMIVLLERLNDTVIARGSGESDIGSGATFDPRIDSSRVQNVFEVLHETGLDLDGAQVVVKRSVSGRENLDEIEQIFTD